MLRFLTTGAGAQQRGGLWSGTLFVSTHIRNWWTKNLEEGRPGFEWEGDVKQGMGLSTTAEFPCRCLTLPSPGGPIRTR